MTRTPYAISLATAMVRTIISLNLVPSSTVKTASLVGDTSLEINDLGPNHPSEIFLPETVMTFWDTSNEEMTSIDERPSPDSDPNLIPFRFNGKGYSGLQQPHDVGALVATNVFRHPLGDNSVAFGNGYPAIGCYMLDNTDRPTRNKRYQEFGILSIEYQLPALQDVLPSLRLDSQIWIGRMLDKGEYEADRIIEWVEQNYRIGVDGTPYVEQVVAFMESRRHNISDPKRPVFQFLLDIHVVGKGSPIR